MVKPSPFVSWQNINAKVMQYSVTGIIEVLIESTLQFSGDFARDALP